MRTQPDISFLLNHAAHVLSTQMSAAFEESGITPRGFCVLNHAVDAERTQAQLAEMSDLDKTTMVVTTDELERCGYAERRPSSADRRARIIAVTPAGREMVEEGARIADRVHEAVLEALPEEEREVFLRALTRLVEGYLATPEESRVRRARSR